MNQYRIIFFFVLCILAGCTSYPTVLANPASSIPPTPDMLVLTPLPTNTPVSTITITPTSQRTSTFKRQCVNIEQANIPLNKVISGTILLFTHENSPDILLDSRTGNEYKLPTLDDGGMVSPNGDMYAYIEHSEHESLTHSTLWVTNAKAEMVSKISLEGWYGPPRWISNKRVILSTIEFGTLLVINPFTGEKILISNELPMLYTLRSGGPWWRVEYSPDLEWAAYFYVEPGGERGTIVYDVVSKQYLWQSTNGDEGQPAWSPDGQEVAVIGAGKLYLVDRSGSAKSISNEIETAAQNPSWSPDGRYIAFWNGEGYSGDNHLMVFDKIAGVVTDYCIESPYPHNPIWSPGSRFVLVNQVLESGAILINIQALTAHRIENIPNSTVFGWMNSLP